MKELRQASEAFRHMTQHERCEQCAAVGEHFRTELLRVVNAQRLRIEALEEYIKKEKSNDAPK